MTLRFGNPATFAIDVGESEGSALRVVNLWAAGKMLTVYDNVAYVPSLAYYMRCTAADVRRRAMSPCPCPERSAVEIFQRLEADETEFREHYWFMRWSEILDNVSCYAYLDNDLVIVFAFRRADHPTAEDLGKVFVARIAPDAFAAIIEQAADVLDAEPVG